MTQLTTFRAAWVCSAGIAALVFGAQAASAQESDDQGSLDGQAGVNEIVVTAQQRTESAQRVPISVSVIGGDTIENSGILSLEALSANIPTVKITEAAGGDQLFIRGVGSGVNPGFEQSVGTFVDGIYYGRGRQIASQLTDVERVEVLKGPQSIYFGNNTIAGAISVTTRKPSFQTEGYASALYEFNHNEWDVQGAVNLPISSKFAVRVAGRFNRRDGWLRNTYLDRTETQRESYAVRSTFLYEPLDNLTAVLKVEYGHVWELGNNYQAIKCPGVLGLAGAPNCSTALANAGTTGFEDIFDRNKQDGSIGPVVHPAFSAENRVHTQKNVDTSLNLSWELADGHTITSITGYTWYDDYRNNVDNEFSPTNILQVPRREKYKQLSQELRLASPTGQTLEYLVGGYFQDSQIDFVDRFIAGIAGGGAIVRTIDLQDHRSLSAFAALTWNLADNLRLVGGLRYTDVQKSTEHGVHLFELDETTDLDPAGVTFFNNAFGMFNSPTTVFERSDSDLTPSLNLQWDVAERVMAYASYVEGFKAGGFDSLARGNAANSDAFVDRINFEPESAKSYEIGIKSIIADGTLRFNLAAFRSDYTDLQVSTFDGTAGFLVGNAGKARAQGIEADFEWAASPDLSILGNVSYLDAKYVEFTTAQCRFVNPRNNPDAPAACIQSGEPLTYSPDWSGSVQVSYTALLTGDLELHVVPAVNFTSKFFTASDNDPNTIQEGYAKVDLRVALAQSDGAWEVAFIGRNLTDKLTTSQSNDLPFGPGSYFAILDRPRTLAVQVRAGF